MAVPRDPNFWRRFSTAVHQDEEAQAQAQIQRPELKHSYVSPLSSPSTTASPTSNTYPHSRSRSNPGSPNSTSPITRTISQDNNNNNVDDHHHQDHYFEKPQSQSFPTPKSPQKAHLSEKSPQPQPQSPKPPLRRTRTLTKTNPNSPKLPKPSHSSPPHPSSPYTSRNPTTHSQLTLGLSGRPPSRFKFWTSVTANPPHHRESWLEEQKRKKKKRGLMCWGFWIVLGVVVAGVVVAVLLLRGKGIL